MLFSEILNDSKSYFPSQKRECDSMKISDCRALYSLRVKIVPGSVLRIFLCRMLVASLRESIFPWSFTNLYLVSVSICIDVIL